MSLPPVRMDSIMFTVNAKMWYSGSAQMLVGCSPAGSLLHHRLVPGLGLQHVGNHVAVQQHRALAHAGGAAGVLQHRDVVGLDVGGLKGVPRVPLAMASLKRTAPGQAELRHHFS